MNYKEIKHKINFLVEEHFKNQKSEYKFTPGSTKIPLIYPSYGYKEVLEALDSMMSTSVTMGRKVKEFEKTFAKYIGIKNSTMVNSGSSANLIALHTLINPEIKKIDVGDEIITPAVTWSTTVYPIINIGCTPSLIDVDLETNCINTDSIKKAITSKTKAIMLVHLMGNVCEMGEIMEIAEKNDLIVIEDACEAHGAEYNGKKVGSFGDMATFSFFFSHHITTIEGGMVLTNNDEYYEVLKSLRTFGWIRDQKNKEKIAKKYNFIDERFLFNNIGFNFRPTEIQGAFGIHQIKLLENFVEIRRENARIWNSELEKYSDYFILPKEKKGTRHAYFGYPITIKPGAPFTKQDIIKFLESKGIETRPLMAGNIAQQPSMKYFKYKKTNLTNSEYIMKNSFFWGNHHMIKEEERQYVIDRVSEFVNSKEK